MAERCGACGSADTSTGADSFKCLDCGAVTKYDGLAEKGVVPDRANAPAAPAKATKKKR